MTPFPVLRPLSWVMAAGTAVRNALYDRGVCRVGRIRRPVVCVGNIAAGGTGKTPFVIRLARLMQAEGIRCAVVSRGYGRTSEGQLIVSDGREVFADVLQAGDEPFLVARSLPGVAVVVDGDRVRGARTAAEQLGADVVLLDDGFQHRRLFRDVDVVLVPAAHVLHPPALLPAGPLREPMRALKRADIVVVTGKSQGSEVQQALEILKQRFPAKPVGAVRFVPEGLQDGATGEGLQAGELSGRPVVAVSGIADPGSFSASLNASGLAVKEHLVFPDHHWYTSGDWERICRVCRSTEAGWVVTTEKDLVRLLRLDDVRGGADRDVRLAALVLRVEYAGGEIQDWLLSRLRSLRHVTGDAAAENGREH